MTDETSKAGEGAIPWLDGLLGRDGVAELAKGVRRQLESRTKGAWKIKSPSLLIGEAARRLAGELHVDVFGFLAEGWNAAAELEDCRSQSRAEPKSTVIATLGRHTISRELKPEIVVTYGGSRSFDVDAAIALEGTFEGIELSFQGGRMVSAGSGRCDIAVQLKVGGKAISHARVHRGWRLPGEYRFRPEPTASGGP